MSLLLNDFWNQLGNRVVGGGGLHQPLPLNQPSYVGGICYKF
jgi:hypothetical protein